MKTTTQRRRRRQAVRDARARQLLDWIERNGPALERLRFEPSEAVAVATADGVWNPTPRRLFRAAAAARVAWPNHWRRMRNRETSLTAKQWSRVDKLVRIATNWNRYDGRSKTVADVANWIERNYSARYRMAVVDAALRATGVVLPFRENWR